MSKLIDKLLKIELYTDIKQGERICDNCGKNLISGLCYGYETDTPYGREYDCSAGISQDCETCLYLWCEECRKQLVEEILPEYKLIKKDKNTTELGKILHDMCPHKDAYGPCYNEDGSRHCSEGCRCNCHKLIIKE